MSFESISLTVEETGVAVLRLEQPERGNPFDARLCDELGRAASALDTDRSVRCVLLESSGRFFSVGGDLSVLGGDGDGGTSRFVNDATIGFNAAVSRFARMDPPVVCAVHGLAAGGGVSLLAGADIVLAARSAKFLAAYQGIGLAIDGGGSHYVPRRVGHGRATSFYLRNETWTADEAHARGLVDELHDDDALRDAARALAVQLAEGPTRAFGEVKRLLASTWDEPLERQLEAEARAMNATGRTQDAADAIAAMRAKERPAFRGE